MTSGQTTPGWPRWCRIRNEPCVREAKEGRPSEGKARKGKSGHSTAARARTTPGYAAVTIITVAVAVDASATMLALARVRLTTPG